MFPVISFVFFGSSFVISKSIENVITILMTYFQATCMIIFCENGKAYGIMELDIDSISGSLHYNTEYAEG